MRVGVWGQRKFLILGHSSERSTSRISSGPLLFLLFVNDLPDWIINSIRMFADDTKMWCVLKDTDDCLSLQSDLDKLMEWSAVEI